MLLLFSYLFYASWNPPFVLLLWISTAVDWFATRRLFKSSSVSKRRVWLLISIAVNLGLLGFFKYGQFLSDNLVHLLSILGVRFEPADLGIVLPVGISFYTFQSMSYTIDVYRRQVRDEANLLDFALYVTFFPQLVAGPIVRATEFLPQCRSQKNINSDQLGWGISLLIWGLFQKVVLADGILSIVTNAVFDGWRQSNCVTAWIGVWAFSGQIYFDFAGYSTAAIGIAMCFGFALPDNFRSPYAAIGFSDFWRRWHISLSTWLRDYVYVGMGGNRCGLMRTYLHLLLTMLIGGLWHGAAWRFVTWGALHGAFLVVERKVTSVPAISSMRLWQHWLVRILLAFFTYLAVCIAWVYFRAGSFEAANSLVLRMIGLQKGVQGASFTVGTMHFAVAMVVVITMFVLHYASRDFTLEDLSRHLPLWGKAFALSIMIFLILSAPSSTQAFIYFQF